MGMGVFSRVREKVLENPPGGEHPVPHEKNPPGPSAVGPAGAEQEECGGTRPIGRRPLREKDKDTHSPDREGQMQTVLRHPRRDGRAERQ